MEENEKITKYLNAIYQNIRTAIQSIEDIIPKAESEALKSELSTEQDEYNCLAKECEAFAKAEKIEGMMDNSSRKIAELMLFGTFMGIVTCVKDKGDHKNVSKELDELIEKLLHFERKNIDKLLPYLEETP